MKYSACIIYYPPPLLSRSFCVDYSAYGPLEIFNWHSTPLKNIHIEILSYSSCLFSAISGNSPVKKRLLLIFRCSGL